MAKAATQPTAREGRSDLSWPMYFATQPLQGRRVSYRAGDLFELQTKDYVRALGPAYGITDADKRPFAELPYVRTLNVRSRGMASQILQQSMTREQAEALVGGAHGE